VLVVDDDDDDGGERKKRRKKITPRPRATTTPTHFSSWLLILSSCATRARLNSSTARGRSSNCFLRFSSGAPSAFSFSVRVVYIDFCPSKPSSE
jgi:hypothetical protein